MMKIGDLSKRTQTLVETIRYYEHEGLLPEPERTESNYRIYGEVHAERLAFIRHCRSLDMTLDEIRQLLRFKDDPASDCGDVNALLSAHIGHVADRIRELRALEKKLKSLRERCCEAQLAANCGILGELSRPTDDKDSKDSPKSHVRKSHLAVAGKG
jgi:Cd(II)/Pb(II)-responsive transcriptional regulator